MIQKVDKSCAADWKKRPKYPNPEWKGCEEPCEAWLDLDNSDELAEYHEKMEAWADTAEATCKDKKETDR